MEHFGEGLIGLVAVLLIFGAPWATLAAIFVVPRYLKSLERRKMQDTIRAAIDRGEPLPADVLDAMTRDMRPSPSAVRDARVGVIWLAVAIGISGFGFAIRYYADEALPPFLAIAAIPAAVGVAFLLLSLFNRSKS